MNNIKVNPAYKHQNTASELLNEGWAHHKNIIEAAVINGLDGLYAYFETISNDPTGAKAWNLYKSLMRKFDSNGAQKQAFEFFNHLHTLVNEAYILG